MTKTDTGIDLCNLIDTIVQCKLRKNNLSWGDMSTFFGSNITCDDHGLKIQWAKLIIARNEDCQLSKHLKYLLQQGKGLASTNIECNKLWNDFVKK